VHWWRSHIKAVIKALLPKRSPKLSFGSSKKKR
jgi:hypothetical protein